MLKWTVITKRSDLQNTSQTPNRRSSTPKRRRSSASTATDKENRFTSTPIKTTTSGDPLRDVSNIKKKPKKRCVDPSHELVDFFKPFDEECPPKRARMEHVSEFLQQLTCVTSPESDDDLVCPKLVEEAKITPLVKKLVDLRFSRIEDDLEDTTCIDDLSLDRLVEAILEESDCKPEVAEKKDSFDSGFKSSSTDNSHRLDDRCVCKCSKIETYENLPMEKTIIDLSETFNERCVDDSSRKRSSSPNQLEFTLKRQRCVRRRKTETERKKSPNFDHSYESTPKEEFRRIRRCLMFDSPEEDEEKRGEIDLSVEYESGKLSVKVLRCLDLQRPSGGQINAYVKVILLDRPNERICSRRHLLQRTPVQADSSNPIFNHTIKLPIQKSDLNKKVLLEVWHRNRTTRRSEFLGCVSFAVKNATRKDISGLYRLRHQRQPPVKAAMCESQSSVEEVMSFDELDNDLRRNTNKTALSQHQKDADENLFLRYLELDPTEGPDAIPAATQRKATGNKNGRTPFTTTKKLIRQPKSGFGFSVVWTHPPRIERVEKGLPADRAGVLPGDYIIFVDKHNVVMMPEVDILNLIKSYGNQLTLEIFRRNVSRNGSVPSVRRFNSAGDSVTESAVNIPQAQRRPSTVCSTNTASVDYNRRKLQLPQVTFSAEKPSNAEEARKKAIYQLIGKEQQYATAMQFAVTRFVAALAERKDLITTTEHKILFQNSEELLRITEDILESVLTDDGEIQTHLVARTYKSKAMELATAYRRYCSGIKRADCILANKTKNSNSDFVRFLQTPAVPRRRPDITVFIHKPLEHYREVLKLLNQVLQHTKFNHEEYQVLGQVVHDLQVSYREITSEAGLMEPTGSGRPLLSVQDLESRLVFTKCKPFVLSKPGRQWIFGGDLGRVEGRNVRQYWTLLFNDILLFAKVSRDRVLFVTEEPLPLINISEMCFNVRKRANEFRVTIQPGGKSAASPTVHCGPDLTRTPKKSANRRTVVLRAPTQELKAVWQNLLQRQIFQVNSAIEGSQFSSPMESPDVPVASSVQSADESVSLRRQTIPQFVPETHPETQRQIDALIEHKCKQLSKSSGGTKGGAIHLEQWMKGQLGDQNETPELEPEPEVWSVEKFRKRSEELKIFDQTRSNKLDLRNESRCEEVLISDHEQSPSKSTTSESQVTVRSSPVVQEPVPVCRECHRRCLANPGCLRRPTSSLEEDWQPLPPSTSLDPFVAPQISVIPATPESSVKNSDTCNCQSKPEIDLELNHELDNSPDDSPLNEDHPYHSLSNSNLTLRRFGTVSSLERLQDQEEYEEVRNSSGSEEGDIDFDRYSADNEAYGHVTLKNWTTRAGSFVIQKMAFFERYLKTTENHINGDDLPEDETSGATSGEEIWGTPTSGGELEDPLSSPNCDDRFSPNSSSDNDESTELMMDELLMTPPITGSIMRGLLPRRTLEPLMEEEYSDTSSTSTETSPSPEQGSGTGGVADTCSTAAEEVEPKSTNPSKMHRSESYRRIVEGAEDEQIEAALINHFKPTVQFVNIDRVPRRKGGKIFQFFHVRRERRIYETFPEGRHLIKLFSKEDTVSNQVPTAYSQKPVSPQKLKDKQMDRRFWKQLSKRRANKSSSPILAPN